MQSLVILWPFVWKEKETFNFSIFFVFEQLRFQGQKQTASRTSGEDWLVERSIYARNL